MLNGWMDVRPVQDRRGGRSASGRCRVLARAPRRLGASLSGPGASVQTASGLGGAVRCRCSDSRVSLKVRRSPFQNANQKLCNYGALEKAQPSAQFSSLPTSGFRVSSTGNGESHTLQLRSFHRPDLSTRLYICYLTFLQLVSQLRENVIVCFLE